MNTSHITKTIILASAMMAISLPVMAAGGKGMTWGFRHMSFPTQANSPYLPSGVTTNPPNNTPLQQESVFMGCNDSWGRKCNAYTGDTQCSTQRAILCVEEQGNAPRPPYIVGNSGGGMSNEFYAGWNPKRIKFGPVVPGTQLTSLAVANNLCGNGWRMAEFHDGYHINGMGQQSNNQFHGNTWNISQAKRGGWNFHARFTGTAQQRNLIKQLRVWVHNNDSSANCWNP